MTEYNSFQKLPLSVEEQVTLLQSRGLIINNVDSCKKFLTYIGYYRLSGYMIPFYTQPSQIHLFKNGTTFEDIIKDYEFDRQLRVLCLNAIEKIEVAFRAVISNYMCLIQKDSHWYSNKNYFFNYKYYNDLRLKLNEELGRPIENIRRKQKEIFIDHYHQKYNYPTLPPSWMIFETLSFGDVSFLFKNLENTYKKNIASYFDMDDKILSSWIHSLCYLRNLCAHHSRVWNREMSISPRVAKRYKNILELGKNNYFFGQTVIIKVLLDKIDSQNNWVNSLNHLFKELNRSTGNILKMGYPTNWENLLLNLK